MQGFLIPTFIEKNISIYDYEYENTEDFTDASCALSRIL